MGIGLDPHLGGAHTEEAVETQSSDESQPEEPSDAQTSTGAAVGSSANANAVTLSSDADQESAHDSAENQDRGKKSHSLRKVLKSINPTPLPELLFNSLVAIVVGAIGAFAASWAFGLLSSGGVDTTQQIYYQPWDADGSAGLSSAVQVEARVSGYCWERSVTTNRPDAYRCISNNTILDPCISSPYEGFLSTEVVCPYPGLQSVTVISLARPLPAVSEKSAGPPYPWLIVLTDGTRCTAFSGAAPITAGIRENYLCIDAGLWGHIDSSGEPWTIFKLQDGSSEVVQAAIAQAYF